ncbi:MAG: CHC2 zinc finger domain-containing protein [Prevotella sp.]|nr:CHC2 zinc finger domain-containing protein [Prevotella sp.]
MNKKFDIERLKAIPIIGVAERLGMEVRGHKARCVFHSPDRHPSLRLDEKKGTCHCFVCGRHANVIDLVMHVMNISFVEACKWLADGNSTYACAYDHATAVNKNESTAATVDLPHLTRLTENPQLNDEAQRFLFEERRISPEVAARMRLGSLTRDVPMSGRLSDGWFNAPALLIPYFSIHGELVSVQARYLGIEKKPRFQFPKGARTILYNAPQLALLQPGDRLSIAEGVSDCLAMLSSGRKAIAIPSATLLSPEDRLMLGEAAARLGGQMEWEMWPDNDRAGSELCRQLALLATDLHITLHHHRLPEGCKDFGDYWKGR